MTKNNSESFSDDKKVRIEKNSNNNVLREVSSAFMRSSIDAKYSYNFSWMGRPIIQYPQDILALQELIWDIKPDLIIETGIAHGGSIIFSASMLELLGGNREVLAIDIDIRPHNRKAIEEHPMSKRIKMIEGSSIDPRVIDKVKKFSKNKKSVLLLLDSNHTHNHVLEELNAYSNLVSVGSYCIVYDTIVEDLKNTSFHDREWDIGNNPKTAVYEFLKSNSSFEIDKKFNDKLLISVAPDGYLKRVK